MLSWKCVILTKICVSQKISQKCVYENVSSDIDQNIYYHEIMITKIPH